MSCQLSSHTHRAGAEGAPDAFAQQRLILDTELGAAYPNMTEQTIPRNAFAGFFFYFTVSKLKEAEKFLLSACRFYLPEGEEGFPWCPAQPV